MFDIIMIEDFQDNSKDRSSRILFNKISYEWRRAGGDILQRNETKNQKYYYVNIKRYFM
jgi:hypothetical protein